MQKCGIYKITNLVNNYCYIGQSIDILTRWKNHKNDGLNKDSTKHKFYYPLYQAFREYGLENFSFEIIEECRREELNTREKYWIKFYNSFESGYNQTEGGDSAPHFNKLTKEQVNLIIEELKNSTENSEVIGEKFGVSGRTIRGINSGNYFYRDDINYPIRPKLYGNGFSFGFVSPDSYCQCCGKKITKGFQFCKPCSQKKVLNRPSPLELARMISEKGFAAVGRDYSVTDNTIKKWCKDYNIPYLKDELIKWYNNQIGLVEDKEIKQKIVLEKQVKQIDLNTNEVLNIYPSINAAARALGKKKGNHIGEVCNGIHNTAYGFKWSYI